MKLVEILAGELEKWPEGVSHLVSSFAGELFGTKNGPPAFDERDKKLTWTILGSACGRSVTWCLHGDIHLKSVPSDYNSAVVTREMWQAERERIAKPGKKANAEGWIRNRGRKCPVQSGTLVDLKLRGGVIHIGKFCDNHPWIHKGEPFDVMYYRINKTAEQPADQGIYADDTGPAVAPVSVVYADADCPLVWRDRIREIDRTVEALEEERVSLIQRLEGEGFRLIDQVNAKISEAAQAHEDASDWRNWEEGDLIESIGKSCGYSPGSIYAISGLDRSRKVVLTVLDDKGSKTNGWHVKFFKFHSRPSA